ncbi:MAG TPA: MOSC domain-containing protein [Candidatus Acidoferrales bacterium]|nr:MOSC domain-containing protein [Candidatus Acidoferrales bacterium]
MGKVEHIFVCLVHRFPMRELDTAELIADKGLKGCIHGKPGSKRQVLLMAAEVMDALNLEPGDVKENFTTSGLDHSQISLGRQLKIGEAILEATGPCEPCYRMDEIRNGLKAELRGRRGWLFRVIQGGKVQRSDEIEFLESPAKQAAD